MDFVAYHDRTSADHQAHFDDLFPKGYRITSLSVYGARGDERYAAVWVKRAGPDWSAVHGVNGAGYQAAFDNAVAAGFKPGAARRDRAGERSRVRGHVRAAAPGRCRSRASGSCAAGSDDRTRRRSTTGSRRRAPTGGCRRAIAIYGTAAELRYAGIWVDNPQRDLLDDGRPGRHAPATTSRASTRWCRSRARPVQVAVSPDDRYASIFRDDLLGDWFARHELTSAGYQQAFDQAVPQGYWPVIGAGRRRGRGGALRGGVRQGRPARPAVWQAPTGPVANAAIDAVMQAGDGAPPDPRRGARAGARRQADLRARLHAGRAGLPGRPADDAVPPGKRQQVDRRAGDPPADPGRAADARDAACRACSDLTHPDGSAVRRDVRAGDDPAPARAPQRAADQPVRRRAERRGGVHRGRPSHLAARRRDADRPLHGRRCRPARRRSRRSTTTGATSCSATS